MDFETFEGSCMILAVNIRLRGKGESTIVSEYEAIFPKIFKFVNILRFIYFMYKRRGFFPLPPWQLILNNK